MLPESRSLSQILQEWLSADSLPNSTKQQLEIWALADELRAKAFGIIPENVEKVIQARLRLFQSVYSEVIQFCYKTGFHSDSLILENLWNLWLPLAMQLAEYRQQQIYPLIQGILGGQGTGKTTLAEILKIILNHLGYSTLSLSLDDLYKTYADRQLLKQKDPRLIWRGPPGTHDVQLGIAVLDELRQSKDFGLEEIENPKSIQVPRFDKSAWGGEGDRTRWEVVENIDIVLFEGWFVGVRPIDPAVFDTAPAPILTEADRTFARDMNAKLQDYVPLWKRLDRLIVLYPPDYRLSQQWRRQAEQKAIASGKSGMTDEKVNLFVEYFWRSLHPDLFVKPFVRNQNWVDLVIEIDGDHSPGAVYRPSDRLT
ncbi:glycerate kinase [Argonema antarcticum]|uniref:glycerate kinase n=1 Tax=Argonema antarcticum TaxID=2942763 RepID=UPI0020114855|nr:glycerate kinase [Argonema antarcticum]MCL1473117.1 glycerate kinase [Argonema antarcticum A004/B2]